MQQIWIKSIENFDEDIVQASDYTQKRVLTSYKNGNDYVLKSQNQNLTFKNEADMINKAEKIRDHLVWDYRHMIVDAYDD